MDGFIKEIKKVNLKAVGALVSCLNLKAAKHELKCECETCTKARDKELDEYCQQTTKED